MAIFPSLAVESIVQVYDRTRLDATRCAVTPDEAAITKVEIRPEASGSWVDVTGTSSQDWFLDWEYSTGGDKTVSVRVTTDGAPTTSTATLTAVSEAADNLFSSDAELTAWEPTILNYIRDGRATYKDVHREAQEQILDWLYAEGIKDVNGDPLTAAAVLNVKEVREWSKFLTLQIIFEGLSNAVDDVFSKKAAKYEGLALRARNRSQIKLDRNGDGTADENEKVEITTVKVVRR